MSPLWFSLPYVPSVQKDIFPGATRPEHETNFHLRLLPGSQMHWTLSPLPRTAIRCTDSVQWHSFAFPLPSVAEFPCLRYSLKLDLTAWRYHFSNKRIVDTFKKPVCVCVCHLHATYGVTAADMHRARTEGQLMSTVNICGLGLTLILHFDSCDVWSANLGPRIYYPGDCLGLPYVKGGVNEDVERILIIKPTRCTNFSTLFLE